MSDEYGASVYDWNEIIRRARLGRTVKTVAFLLSSRANPDGTRVFPGVARIAVECEISYNVAQSAMTTLRNAGLIERVTQGNRHKGHADMYRLILAPDVLDRIEVLMPNDVMRAIEKLTAQHSGGRHRKPETIEGLHPLPWGAESDVCTPPEGAQTSPETGLHHIRRGADMTTPEMSAPHGVGSEPMSAPHFGVSLHPTPLATTNPLPKPLSATKPTDGTVPTNLTVSRATGPEDPKIEVLPVKCTHGFRARRRPDGTSSCALCRVTERLSPGARAAPA